MDPIVAQINAIEEAKKRILLHRPKDVYKGQWQDLHDARDEARQDLVDDILEDLDELMAEYARQHEHIDTGDEKCVCGAYL